MAKILVDIDFTNCLYSLYTIQINIEIKVCRRHEKTNTVVSCSGELFHFHVCEICSVF